MSAQTTHSKDVIIKKLTDEVTYYGAQKNGTLTGDGIVTCFRNVTRIELRMRISELPVELWMYFHEAQSASQNVFTAKVVVGRLEQINKMGAGAT